MRRVLITFVALAVSAGFANTYVFLRGMDIGTLDPVEPSNNITLNVIENIYERLYGYDGASVELTPQLATSYEASEDGLTHTFRLREGVTFHSGNPFTCADVEYSLKNAMLTFPDTMAEAVFGLDVSGAYTFGDDTPEEEYAEYWAKLNGSVECADPMTAVVRVLDSDPLLLARLSTHRYSILDSEWAKANGMWDGTEATWRDWIHADRHEAHMQGNASGTGAYRIAEWEPGVRLVAEHYTGYWGATPALDTIVYQVVDAEADRIAALLAGEADQIDFGWEDIPIDELAEAPGVRILDPGVNPELPWGLTSVWAVLFNYNIDVNENDFAGSGRLDGLGIPTDFFTDIDARKCFAYAFDPAAYNEDVWNGSALTLTMAVAPQFDAYDETIPEYHLDLEKAEEHCRAAWGGELWERGFYFTIPYPPDFPMFENVAQQFQKNLKALNSKFDIDMVEKSWDDFFDAADADYVPMEVLGSPFSLPDAAGFMTTWYHSANSWPSLYGYQNEEIDRLIEEVRTEFDQDKRNANYKQVGRLGYDDAMFILLPNGPYTMVVSDKVSGAYRNPMRMEVRWQDLTKSP